MAANKVVLDGLLDARHMAGRALAASTVDRMMRMFRNGPLQPGWIRRGVARQAKRVALRNHARGVLVAMHVVAIEAAQLPVVHGALHKVVALHPVLVRRHVSILIEVGYAGLPSFQLPEIRQLLADFISHGPVVTFCPELGFASGCPWLWHWMQVSLPRTKSSAAGFTMFFFVGWAAGRLPIRDTSRSNT